MSPQLHPVSVFSAKTQMFFYRGKGENQNWEVGRSLSEELLGVNQSIEMADWSEGK